jgi:hypothetical protein
MVSYDSIDTIASSMVSVPCNKYTTALLRGTGWLSNAPEDFGTLVEPEREAFLPHRGSTTAAAAAAVAAAALSHTCIDATLNVRIYQVS